MFCPTAVDAFFQEKFSQLDLSLSRSHINTSGYQDRVSQEEREKEAVETKKRYPTKIPLVIERHHSERNLQEIDKIKWLVPRDMTLAQLTVVIKQRVHCPPGHHLFLRPEHRDIPGLLSSFSFLHSQYANTDGFLYLSYSSQEVYG